MRYFGGNLAGSLGQRITATAGNFGALTNTLVGRIIPPLIDVGGAVIIFSSIDSTLTAALLAFVVVVTAGLMGKDMALSLVDVAQQFGFIEVTLAVIAKPSTVRDAPGAPDLPRRAGAVELRNVTFAYGRGRNALEDVSLFIAAGQKVGIVGPSGAGKSTLVHLRQRLYDVDRSAILIDGHPIAGVTQDSLRGALAVVPQEISLLHRSVMENIWIARPEADDEAVFLAARAAACDGFVRRLPQQDATPVGERGAKLSGGQRQRIGIARAFLKDAPIVLFDEATSALNTESEMAIQAALVRVLRGRTLIAVAHRLSTLTSFDRILVIRDGSIVEDGTFDALRRAGGVFERMWRLQAEGLAQDSAESQVMEPV